MTLAVASPNATIIVQCFVYMCVAEKALRRLCRCEGSPEHLTASAGLCIKHQVLISHFTHFMKVETLCTCEQHRFTRALTCGTP